MAVIPPNDTGEHASFLGQTLSMGRGASDLFWAGFNSVLYKQQIPHLMAQVIGAVSCKNPVNPYEP
jgi:hypothetical protein